MASNNKFEFKVITDSKGNNVRLDSMPLDAAKAFLTFYQTLVNMVELLGDEEGSHVAIKTGSACAVVEGAVANLILQEFEAVASAKSTNSPIVNLWKGVQDQVQANGLLYEINYVSKDGVYSLHNRIKNAKKFKKKPVRTKYSNSIEFLHGKLIEAGGVKPNIHVDVNGQKLTIDCDEDNAVNAISYLYKEIRISVWAKNKDGKGKSYELCDVYENNAYYYAFKELFDQLNVSDKIGGLTLIHRHIKEQLKNENFDYLRKLLLLWGHDTTDIQTLKIILVITSAFRGDERIEKKLKRIEELFEKQDARYAKKFKKKRKNEG
jgi:hypothetical protein